MTVFKGENGGRISINEAGGWILHPSPLYIDWLTLQMLPCLSDQPAGLLRWLLGGRELVIFFLFF